MDKMISSPKPREGAWLWFVKLIGGVFILALLALHFIVNHLVAPGGLLSYQDVVKYYSNPIIPIIEITFLIFVIGHSFLGIRSIILDLNPSDRVLKLINWVLSILGIAAVIYGIWLTTTIAARGV